MAYKTSPLTASAALVQLTGKLASCAIGADRVRFGIVSHPAEIDAETAVTGTAHLMEMGVTRRDLAGCSAEQAAAWRTADRITLEDMTEAVMIVVNCDEAGPGRLDEMIAFLAAQTTDRRGRDRPRVAVLLTQGAVATVSDAVRRATGSGPTAFLVLD